jgi:hypothetical protein
VKWFIPFSFISVGKFYIHTTKQENLDLIAVPEPE